MHSGSVNFVWNYCNDVQQQAVARRKPWFSGFDLSNLTSGSSKELKLHSQTVQAVCEEYAKKRSQFNKPFLKFRTNKNNRNLPWIPFKKVGINFDGKGTFTFMGFDVESLPHAWGLKDELFPESEQVPRLPHAWGLKAR